MKTILAIIFPILLPFAFSQADDYPTCAGKITPFITKECTQQSIANSTACCFYKKVENFVTTLKCLELPINLSFLAPYVGSSLSLTSDYLDCGESEQKKSHYICGYNPTKFENCEQYSNSTQSCCYVQNPTTKKAICIWGKDRKSLGVNVMGMNVTCHGSYFSSGLLLINVILIVWFIFMN